MVAGPHDQDRGKTRYKREVRRPLLDQRATQRGHRDRSLRQVWHLQVEHQQCNCDGKDTIAEGFEATSLFFDSPCSLFTAHSFSPSSYARQLLSGGGTANI